MRKGLLAAAALALGNSSADAQYWQAPPYPYNPAANRAVWVMPPQATPQMLPKQISQQALPQQMLPQQMLPQQMLPQQALPQQRMPQQTTVVPQQGMPRQLPGYSFNPAPRSIYPGATPSYLPQGYFPAHARVIPAPAPVTLAPVTPVPPEPKRGDAKSAGNSAVTSSTTTVTTTVPFNATAMPFNATRLVPPPAATSSRAISYGPAMFLDTVQAPPKIVVPEEPVVFHRECHERGWVSADYLLGWMTHGPLGVPLVTTGPSIEKGGALDAPGTIVLFGNRDLDFRMLHGVRLEAGWFADDDNRFSFDISGFYYLPRHVRFGIRSDASGLPVIGRPIFNAAENDEDVYQIAFPLVDPDAPFAVAGATEVDARAQIWGLEINGRWHSYCRRRLHSELLVGFRHIHLNEHLLIRDSSLNLFDDSGLSLGGRPLVAGDILVDQDYFETNNRFFGFQVGGRARWEHDRAFLEVLGKIGLGVTDQQVRIEGLSSVISPNGNLSAPGGILALPSNMGDHNRQVFGVVPEIGVNVGVEVTDHVRFKLGYSCLMWSGVARPGAQIDRSINVVQVPTDQDFGGAVGAARPQFQFREEVFFLQSFNFGIEFHF